MFPSQPIDWVTRRPVIENVTYQTRGGEARAELYRPPGQGPYPAVLICLGVVPFGVDHPQIPRLKEALARFGFVALIHWSPAMRDRRLVPEDIENIAAAYDYLLRRPDVDPARSGLFGTCVAGRSPFWRRHIRPFATALRSSARSRRTPPCGPSPVTSRVARARTVDPASLGLSIHSRSTCSFGR